MEDIYTNGKSSGQNHFAPDVSWSLKQTLTTNEAVFFPIKLLGNFIATGSLHLVKYTLLVAMGTYCTIVIG